jgi:iron complex transport system permease protein
VLASLTLGYYPIDIGKIAHILATAPFGETGSSGAGLPVERLVVLSVRLPRILLSMLAGAGLALSGTVLQGLFRTPRVGPQVVGVSPFRPGQWWGRIIAACCRPRP